MATTKDNATQTVSVVLDPASPAVQHRPTHRVRFSPSIVSNSDPAQIDVEVTHVSSEQTFNNTGLSIMTAAPMFLNKSQSYERNNNDTNNNNKDSSSDNIVHYINKPEDRHVTILNRDGDWQNSESEPPVIRTITDQYYQSPRRPDWQRALTQRYLTILLTVSIISAFIFFPIGIPAVWFALKTREEFDRGIMLGDIVKAQRYARRAQQLAIFAFIFCLLTVILTLAIYNRVVNAGQYQYVDHGGALP